MLGKGSFGKVYLVSTRLGYHRVILGSGPGFTKVGARFYYGVRFY